MQNRGIYFILVLAAFALAGTARAAAPAPITARAVSRDYRFELDIGHMEHMFTAEQVKAKHLTEGEIMVGGKMAMAKGPGWHHLELHVRSKMTGTPVTGAKVRIAVTDLADHQRATVPIAVMYGIKAGKADWHYGNNVKLQPGKYRIDASANGEQVHFDLTIPAG